MKQGNFVDDQIAASVPSQPALFEDSRDDQVADILGNQRAGLIFSWTDNERELIINIARLHAPMWFDLDPTYSRGVFWKGLPSPLYMSDISPQMAGVREADACYLPHYGNQSIRSIMFDPPFVVGDTKPGIIKKRFGLYKSIPDLWAFYARALHEFYRILKPKGVLVFKCQDTVDSGRNYMTHAAVIDMAEKIGFYNKDLFVLTRSHALISPNVRPDNQQHARKTHCYYLVFTKESRPDRTAISQVDEILLNIEEVGLKC